MTVKSGKGRGSKDPAPQQAPDVPSVIQAHFTPEAGGSPGSQLSVPSSYTAYSGNAAFVRLSQTVEPYQTERKKDGSPYLVDLCPNIDGTTPRDKIIPNIPWQLLKERNTAEWRCWIIIQRWRLFMHVKERLAFKKKCGNAHGALLCMFKDRTRGVTHWLDREYPPGTLPDDGSRESAYPNAKYLDRSQPRPSEDVPRLSHVARHRIMH